MLPQSYFTHILPKARLGQCHSSKGSFLDAVFNDQNSSSNEKNAKEFTLVIVTECSTTTSRRRILLGLKRRGFGTGFYNCFGGKLDANVDQSILCGAARELMEETNILVPASEKLLKPVGQLRFTFEDKSQDETMLIHLFHLHNYTNSNTILDILGCDEIEPRWFESWKDIPFHQMFADDSIWLPILLSSSINDDDDYQNETVPINMDGYFHYAKGGTTTNTILHYYLSVQKPATTSHPNKAVECVFTLEQKLFHTLHNKNENNDRKRNGRIPIKEFKECWAFVNAVRSCLESDYDYVLDVAGGHGALAALFLVLTSAQTAFVIDPHLVENGKNLIEDAWKNSFFPNKSLHYFQECLRTALPRQLKNILQSVPCHRILVVACHACQHLTDDTISIAESYGVHIAVMPCCHKDHDGTWKSVVNNIRKRTELQEHKNDDEAHRKQRTSKIQPHLLDIGLVMDIATAGKMSSPYAGKNAGVMYKVKIKFIDPSITPQNRLIVCKSIPVLHDKNSRVEAAHKRLQKAYNKAHAESSVRARSHLKKCNQGDNESRSSTANIRNGDLANDRCNSPLKETAISGRRSYLNCMSRVFLPCCCCLSLLLGFYLGVAVCSYRH